MKRRNRDINIINMSALDLFASGMGVFILLAVVAMPYYLNTSRAGNALIGIRTEAKSFVFVIDLSGSMEQYKQLMIETTQSLIEPMSPMNKIQIMGFGEAAASSVVHWQPPYNLVSMNKQNKQAAMLYIQQNIPAMFGGGTPTFEALIQALKYDAEAIILVTDGDPTDATPDQIVNLITQMNAGQKQIHCIALGSYALAVNETKFLQNLAKQNNGRFIAMESN